ncbi:MAG: SGNH/GDSL hydrolase family protein [Planctomycetota bacterium]
MGQKPDAAPSAKASFGKKLLLLLGTLVVILTLLEVAMRVRMKMKYGRTGNEFYASEVHPAAGFRVPLPDQEIGPLHINSHGFRGPELETPKPGGRVRIAFLGASTTFCAEASSDEKTWPGQLIRMLSERFPMNEFDYVNGGIPGIGADESRRNLEYRIAPLQPDIMVIYHATNDLSRDTRLLAEKQGLFTVKGDERSFLARISVTWDLIEKNLKVRARTRAAMNEGDRLQFDATELSAQYRQVLTRLVEKAKSLCDRVVVVTFSTRLRKEQSAEERLAACNTSLLYMPYMTVDGLLAGFAAYNQVNREVAAATGSLLVDGEDSIPANEAMFKDSVHLSDLGCEKMAARIFSRLVEDPGFLEILRKRER